MKSGSKRTNHRCHRRGAAIVEMAIVTPLIFTLCFAGIEVGRVLMAMHGLEEAAREGCRMAVLDDATLDDVSNTVTDRLMTFGVSGHTLATDPVAPETACQWDPVSVSITVPYDNVSWFPTPLFLSDIVLSASCTLSMESDRCTNN